MTAPEQATWARAGLDTIVQLGCSSPSAMGNRERRVVGRYRPGALWLRVLALRDGSRRPLRRGELRSLAAKRSCSCLACSAGETLSATRLTAVRRSHDGSRAGSLCA